MAKQKSPGKKTPTENEEQETEDQTSDETEDDSENGEDENKRINAIVTNRVKRELKPILSALTAMQETMKGLATPKKTEGEDEDEEDTAAKKAEADKTAVKDSKWKTRMEKELAEEREARKKAEKLQSEQAEANRRNEMRSLFQQALVEHGVTDPRLMRAALDQLEQDGYMIRDEGDKVKYKGTDKYGMEAMYDPKTGVKTWIQSEGKSFVPAVDAGGSGSGGARNQGQGSQMGKSAFSKLSDREKAAIELDRASRGLPPLE
jgi:hypothetical protein